MEEDFYTQQRDVQKNPTNADRIKYVQELADADDAWITIPHAARITGASESMANRWVKSGRLPIRGNPDTGQEELVGIPPRTRSCRLSDVKRIRPILYPDLVTGSAVRTLDVPSIPQEVARITNAQGQINNDHQQLRGELAELQDTVGNSTIQFRHDMHLQREDLSRQMREAYEASAAQLQQIEEQLKGMLQSVSSDLTEQQKDLQTLHDELHEANADHKAAIDDLLRDVSRQHTEIRAEFMTTIEEEQEAVANRMQELRDEQEKARKQQQALMDRSLLVYQQRVDEALVNLEGRIISEAAQRQEQLARLSEQIAGTAQQFDLFLKTTNKHQEDLIGQLEQAKQHTDQLERIVHEQDVRFARVEKLEQIVAEQGKQLASYESLLQLTGRFESLYRELIDRGLLQAEIVPDR